LRRFEGVSEAIAKREPSAEIPSKARGSPLPLEFINARRESGSTSCDSAQGTV
jgi:hypothetical protein